MNRTLGDFEDAVDKIITMDLKVDPTAAAILVLAETIRSKTFDEDFSHYLCLGIRKGLFGSNAPDNVDISDAITSIAENMPNDQQN